MKTIKFRGLDVSTDEWVYGSPIGDFAIYSGVYVQKIKEGTMGQFTGLLDRAGKDIYEGDIVQYSDAVDGESLSGRVTYCEELGAFCVKPEHSELFGLNADVEFEVIGDVHQLPPVKERKAKRYAAGKLRDCFNGEAPDSSKTSTLFTYYDIKRAYSAGYTDREQSQIPETNTEKK